MDELPADLIVVNAKIYTMDSQLSWASTLAVRDGKFAAIGTNDTIRGLIGSRTEIFDAKHAVILPGLFNSHCHAFEGARADLFEIRLSPADDFTEVIGKVASAVASQKEGSWLRGAGWSLKWLSEFSAERSLDRFDDVTGSRPVILRDLRHHALFANSSAMKLAGLTRDIVGVEAGTVVKDAVGNLSGLFLKKPVR